jgi:hypothetical protein
MTFMDLIRKGMGIEDGAEASDFKFDGDRIHVVTEAGDVVRTYSLADHGEDFLSLAGQYAEKKGHLLAVQSDLID